MTHGPAQTAYSALPPKGQTRFLAILAHEITVWARNAYPEIEKDREAAVSRLRAFNELQHKVGGQLIPVLEDDPKRYPDDVFVDILFDIARQASCEKQLAQEFEDLRAALLRVEA